jgi:hypothetical protein
MDTITIPQEYVHRLARIQAARQKLSGQKISLPGIVEAILSDWLYHQESELELFPRGLPVEEINGTRYYRDERLSEYRNVENPHDRLAFNTIQSSSRSDSVRRMTPQTITREEWIEIFRLPQIRAAWGLDDQSTPEEFARVCYGARFDFVSGGPGYCGDVYVLYGDALSGVPIILIRDTEHRLTIFENDER